jgi:hypothetical protein
MILHTLTALQVRVKFMNYMGIFITPTYIILVIYIPT